MDGKSLDIAADKLDRLKELLPEAFSEGQIDWEKLRLALGADINIKDERYVLNWAGKSDAFRALQSPTTATLAPARDESVDFDNTQNIFIEGENLEVLKVLQKAYYGRVKMIYIDPPYNTGNDSFVYPDKFSESREEYLQRIQAKDVEGNLLKDEQFRPNSKDSGHYHSNWLSMMYPRLFFARNLLKEDGLIFISIDDNEVHNLRLLMNEVFGEENLIACLIWHRRQMADSRNQDRASTDHEYVLVYRKESAILRGRDIDVNKYSNPDNDPRGSWFSADLTGLATKERRPNLHYTITNPATGNKYDPPPSRGWSVAKNTFERLISENRILWPSKPNGRPRVKKFLDEKDELVTSISTMLDVGYTTEGTREIQELFGVKVIEFPKPISLIKLLVQQGTPEEFDNPIILDFFSGSSTTAHAVIEMNLQDNSNRRYILVQFPEPIDNENFSTVSEIGKERIRRVIKKISTEDPMFSKQGLDLGFKVFKLRHSNFKLWRGDGLEDEAALNEQLELLQESVRQDAQEENLLYELLLKAGYPLTTTLEKHEVQGAHFYLAGGEVVLALDAFNPAMVTAILEQRPKQFICLDRLFANDDQLKTNTQLQFEDAGIVFHSI